MLLINSNFQGTDDHIEMDEEITPYQQLDLDSVLSIYNYQSHPLG
jgi:hypothetical protein